MLLSILLFALGMPEIILIALVALLFFGGKKIPELMRGLGKGVSEFKKGVKDIEDDIKTEIKTDSTTDDNKKA
ncbi:MAG: twin-arginine translocase TatA/TatE family subunit [Paludibacter sp.]|nr:twin-arginine translocase TatA/TatE family subunit [Paludibacter sp.]